MKGTAAYSHQRTRVDKSGPTDARVRVHVKKKILFGPARALCRAMAFVDTREVSPRALTTHIIKASKERETSFGPFVIVYPIHV